MPVPSLTPSPDVQGGWCSRTHVKSCLSLSRSLPPRPVLSPSVLTAIRYFIPAFGGKSYLAFKMMKAYHTVRIAMEFRASELSGLLLYNAQSRGKDFISLALVSSFVELRWVPLAIRLGPSPLSGEGSGAAWLREQGPNSPGRSMGRSVIESTDSSVSFYHAGPSVQGASQPGCPQPELSA